MAKKLNVLLIDDDVDDRDLFCEVLRSTTINADCYTASNGQKAFHLLNTGEVQKPDIIFLDINMPVMNGWQFLSAIKNLVLYKNTPVIIYSTSAHKEDIEKAKQLGALSFFTKPYDLKVLKENLEIIIGNIIRGAVLPIPFQPR